MLDCKKVHTIDCNSTVYRSLVGGGGSISQDGGGGGCSEGGGESRGGEDGCDGCVGGRQRPAPDRAAGRRALCAVNLPPILLRCMV